MALVDPDSKQKFFPLTFEEVPEEFLQKAKTELNENEENVKKGLEILRELIRRDNLPFSTDENFLIPFLRPAKFDFNKADDKLRRFQKYWKKYTELLDTTSIESLQAILDSKMIGVLPFRDQQGRAIIYTRPNFWNKELFDMNDAQACFLGLCVFLGIYPLSAISGVVYICDAHIDNIFDYYPILDALRKIIPCLNWAPFRFSRIDMVNEPAICRYFYRAVKPFLPPKLRNRVFFHKPGFEAFRKIYHPSMLPYEFGGTLGPLSNDSYKEKFLAQSEKIKLNFKHNKDIKFDM